MIRNDCNFRGNLTRDPETRQTPGGAVVVNFSIAVNGFKKDDVTYVDCEAWEKTAEFIGGNCVKGDQVAVKAEFKVDRFTDKEGVDRQKPRFRVLELDAVKLKKWSKDDDDGDAEADEAPRKKPAKAKKKVEVDDDDDDIPF